MKKYAIPQILFFFCKNLGKIRKMLRFGPRMRPPAVPAEFDSRLLRFVKLEIV